jgi:porin
MALRLISRPASVRSRKALLRGVLPMLVASVSQLRGAEQSVTNAGPEHLLLIGPLGRNVQVPTNEVPPSLLPPQALGLKSQIPTPTRGQSVSEPVLQRLREARAGQDEFEWFPAFQPRLMPYLAAQDEFGNTAVKPGPLIPSTPLDAAAQRAKYWVFEVGLRYSLEQTFTWVSMTDVMQGANTLGFYTFDFAGKWALFNAPHAGSAGWISAQVEAKTGLGVNGKTQDAQSNLGTFTNPTGIWSDVNGFRIPELAWQQSLRDGEVVVLAGMVGQGNYIDVNTYANSGRGQFLNSALINSMILPLPNYSLGANLQWQPHSDWYAMVGASAGGTSAGHAPWTDFTWDTWSVVGEFGYAPKDVLGLGPGVYRVQPFVGQADGPHRAGLCFNLQQQLGERAPFGWFGRFGWSASDVTSGASAQVGTGFVMKGPLAGVGLSPSRNHDAAGIGIVWSHLASDSGTSVFAAHENEYVLEAGYVLQLTPTMKLQPDLQFVWNPAFNAQSDQALVFQLQLDVAW